MCFFPTYHQVSFRCVYSQLRHGACIHRYHVLSGHETHAALDLRGFHPEAMVPDDFVPLEFHC